MSNPAMAMGGEAAVTPAALGWKFIHWGLGLFITGFAVGYIPILHYMVGAQEGDVGPVFLKNITLWWGCPAVLAEMVLKHGSLGMLAIGLCYLAAARQGASSVVSAHERVAVKLCAYGLIAEIVTAGVGFFLGNMIWPNFYFEPVETGKNVWLAAQGLSITVFFVGTCYGVAGIRRAGGSSSMTHLSTSLPTDGNPKDYRDLHAVFQSSQPFLRRWLWQEGRWKPIAWFCGIAAGAFWVYSGMPLICH